jgi:hypothetical protein
VQKSKILLVSRFFTFPKLFLDFAHKKKKLKRLSSAVVITKFGFQHFKVKIDVKVEYIQKRLKFKRF